MNQQEKEFSELLGSIPGISFKGFSLDFSQRYPPLEQWREVASFDRAALEAVSLEASPEELGTWFEGVVKRHIRAKRVLLSVGGFGRLPWAEVEISSSVHPLAELWIRIESRELLIADPLLSVILGISSEEYAFECRSISLN